MKRLWWRVLDRLFPRYVWGVDPGTSSSIGCVTVWQKKRDGTLWLTSHSFGPTGDE